MTLSQYFITREENSFIWIRGILSIGNNTNSSCCMQGDLAEEDVSYYVIENTVHMMKIPFCKVVKALKLADNIESFLIYDPIKKCFNYLYFWQERNRTKQEFISWLEKCSKRAIKCVSMYTI